MSNSSNSWSLAASSRRRGNEEDGHWSSRHGGVPSSLPYHRQEDTTGHAYTPWRLFEERVRTGPYGLYRFPSQPYSPVRILVFDSSGSNSVNPRLRQFIQNSPPRIRGEWHLQQRLPETDQDPGLTPDEFNRAMMKLRKQTYSPTNSRRRSWRKGLFSSRINNNNNNAAVEEEDANENRDCTICLETFVPNDQLLVTPCNHTFHHDCLVPWVKSRGQCPVCRLMLYERRGSTSRSSYHNHAQRSGTVDGFRINANEEVLALDVIYLIRAMEEAFNWINISR